MGLKKTAKNKVYNHEPRRGGWIYFIRIKVPGSPIKIGRTSKLKLRFSDMQVAMPWEIEVLLIALDHENYEADLHQHFKSLWVRGEWFSPHESLLNLIADLRGQADNALAIGAVIIPEFTGNVRDWLEQHKTEPMAKAVETAPSFAEQVSEQTPDWLASTVEPSTRTLRFTRRPKASPTMPVSHAPSGLATTK